MPAFFSWEVMRKKSLIQGIQKKYFKRFTCFPEPILRGNTLKKLLHLSIFKYGSSEKGSFLVQSIIQSFFDHSLILRLRNRPAGSLRRFKQRRFNCRRHQRRGSERGFFSRAEFEHISKRLRCAERDAGAKSGIGSGIDQYVDGSGNDTGIFNCRDFNIVELDIGFDSDLDGRIDFERINSAGIVHAHSLWTGCEPLYAELQRRFQQLQ